MFGKLIDSTELEAQQLFVAWTRHFREQDTSLAWRSTEVAKTLYLPESNALLVGIIDAEGDDFFAEHKTANPRGMKTWKREWLLSTQALTYGLLTGGTKPFLVRKIFKSTTPKCDHNWYAFDPRDLAMWRRQVLIMADEIRHYSRSVWDKTGTPWPMSIEHGCFAYGPNYTCPFWEHGCTVHNFDGDIPGNLGYMEFPEFGGENRDILFKAMTEHPNALVLSKTRMNTWQRCREMYRRLYHERRFSFPMGVAADLGSKFHSLVAQYTQKLIAARAAKG